MTFVYQGPFKKNSSTGFRVINEVVLEGEFCELRIDGVLRSSFSHLTQSLQEVVHLGDAPSRLLMLACLQWGCATTSQSAPSTSREEQRVIFRGISIYRIEGGQIAESWSVSDDLGLMRQIGAIPEEGQEAGG